MNSIFQNNYLTSVIEGGFKDYDENRLTKIFCATFNNSNTFKKLFYDFIDYKHDLHLVAFEQCHFYGKTQRRNLLDICIGKTKKDGRLDHKKIKIVIEVKKESPLTSTQLENYDKITNIDKAIKFSILKYYEESIRKHWHLIYWPELYAHITVWTHKNSNNDNKSMLEMFLINNFVNYMKNNNMDIPEIIKRQEIDFLKVIYDYNKNISFRKYQPFETITNILNMMRMTINKAKEKPIIKKYSDKKNFRFSPHITGWVITDKYRLPQIRCTINLKKNKSYSFLDTGIEFDTKKNKEIRVRIYSRIVDKHREYCGDGPEFNSGDLKFEDYCKETIKYWERELRKI